MPFDGGDDGNERPPLGLLALPPIRSSLTLAEAREILAWNLEEGLDCLCCAQRAQVYRWSLYSTAARLLFRLYRVGGTTKFVESKAVKGVGQGDASRLRMWGLVEQESDRRPDGGKSGWWRVTELGERFIYKQATIPRHTWVYDGAVVWQEGDPRTIEDALGKHFNWRDMMEGDF